MRIWPVIRLVAAAFLAVSLSFAQRGQTGGGATPTAPAPGGTTTPTPTPTPTPRPTTQNPTQTDTPQPSRPIWVTGTVMMYDGSPPPDPVTIDRVCSSNSVHPEGYTDSTGHFSFNLGQNTGVFADASTSIFSVPGQFGGNSGASGTGGGGGGLGNTSQDSQYWDCELRARLPGYQFRVYKTHKWLI